MGEVDIMTQTGLTEILRQEVGRGTITAAEVGTFLGDGNRDRIKKQYLDGLKAIKGHYIISEVAARLYAAMK